MAPVAARDLAAVGDLTQQATLPFEFNSVEMEHDSYKGLQVRLRYPLFSVLLVICFHCEKA